MRAKKTQSLSFSRESSMYTSVMRTIGEELQQPEKKKPIFNWHYVGRTFIEARG